MKIIGYLLFLMLIPPFLGIGIVCIIGLIFSLLTIVMAIPALLISSLLLGMFQILFAGCTKIIKNDTSLCSLSEKFAYFSGLIFSTFALCFLFFYSPNDINMEYYSSGPEFMHVFPLVLLAIASISLIIIRVLLNKKKSIETSSS